MAYSENREEPQAISDPLSRLLTTLRSPYVILVGAALA